MKDFDQIIFGILATASGCIWLYFSIFGSKGVSLFGAVIGLRCLLYFPIECWKRKRKIEEIKCKFNLDGYYSLEELEKIRIERDYQDNFVHKLKLD